MTPRKFTAADRPVEFFFIRDAAGVVMAEVTGQNTAKQMAASGELAEACLAALPLLRHFEQIHERTDNLSEEKAAELRQLIQQIGEALDKAGLVEEIGG